MRFSIIIIALLFSAYAQAQTNDSVQVNVITTIEKQTPNKGKITIVQDAQITELVNRHVQINVDNESQIEGWRIQIYNSSGSESKKEALEIRNKFLAKYPDIKAYTVYQPPFFKIRVGNFRTREEAFFYFKEIVKDFPISYLVQGKIDLPKL